MPAELRSLARTRDALTSTALAVTPSSAATSAGPVPSASAPRSRTTSAGASVRGHGPWRTPRGGPGAASPSCHLLRRNDPATRPVRPCSRRCRRRARSARVFIVTRHSHVRNRPRPRRGRTSGGPSRDWPGSPGPYRRVVLRVDPLLHVGRISGSYSEKNSCQPVALAGRGPAQGVSCAVTVMAVRPF